MDRPEMNRRQFLSTSSASLASALAAGKPKRVGLIGCGWYGKCDLFRLIQVSPVEVVFALRRVDKQMLSQAAEMVSSRQASKKVPRTYGDYREMLKEKDLDIVLVATPDHWHALAMIAAVKSGSDVYVQKPISTDIVEAQAMLAVARKYKRVVQVGMQRRSTPHLIEARENIVAAGKLGKIAYVDICCYTRPNRGNPPDTDPPAYLDYEMWTGPAPMRPFQRADSSGPVARFHGVRQRDDRRHGHPHVRHGSLDDGSGLAEERVVIGRNPDQQGRQGEHLRHANRGLRLRRDQDGLESPALGRGLLLDPKYTWAATLYGDKGTLKAGLNGYDFTPLGKGEAIHRDCVYELEQYPEDKTEARLEKNVAPAIRGHMRNFLANIASRGKPVSDIEQGYISTASCILANLAMQTGRTLAWDAAQHRIANDEAADRLLQRPYRQPWNHPDPKTV